MHDKAPSRSRARDGRAAPPGAGARVARPPHRGGGGGDAPGRWTRPAARSDRLEDGVKEKDRKAETDEAQVDGKTVRYLVEFPGLTVEDKLALRASKAGTYHQTGKIPYTAVIDPWTLAELKSGNGGPGARTLQQAVLEAKKALAKEHGKGVSRKDLALVPDADREAKAKAEKGDFAAALDRLAKLDAKAAKWLDTLKEQLKTAKADVIAGAEQALAAIEEKKPSDAAAAKKELVTLATRLRGRSPTPGRSCRWTNTPTRCARSSPPAPAPDRDVGA